MWILVFIHHKSIIISVLAKCFLILYIRQCTLYQIYSVLYKYSRYMLIYTCT